MEEKISFTIATNKIQFLGINITRYVKKNMRKTFVHFWNGNGKIALVLNVSPYKVNIEI